MQTAATRDLLLERVLNIDHEQFEQFCKMLIERAEQTRDLELTPFRGDGGIDVHAIIDRDLFHARLGVQAKQYQPSNTVGARTLRSFKGALADQEYHIGTVITTSSFTSGAIESAERDYIRLIDGERLIDAMLAGEIGVNEINKEDYEEDPEFWEVFEHPEREDVVPSIEVPLANSFETLRAVLRAIDSTDGSKHAITSSVQESTEESFASRHADLYGTAGWLLGFVHKDTPVEVNGREQRRWGLTRSGVKYLAHHDQEDDEAEEMLVAGICNVEIVDRVYQALEDAETLSTDALKTVLEEETQLSESSVDRRASTVGQWLTKLPDITTERRGRTKVYVLA